MPVHGDHAEGEGGGEAEHQREKGGDIAEDRGVGENPAIRENLDTTNYIKRAKLEQSLVIKAFLS